MTYQFALVGNPNSGKTSTFNQLTGAKQTVGNWPGVTVERKSGKLRKAKEITIQDLPGIYSLSPYTPEEVISRNYLAEAPIDAVIDIVDGTNLERNLYLTLQLLEMGLPTIVGINMIDLLKRKGIQINFEKLAYGLGVPVVGISALKQQGLNKLIDAAKKRAGNGQSSVIYDSRLEAALAEIIGLLPTEIPESKRRWIAVKLFEGDELIRQQVALTPSDEKELAEIIKITEMIFDEQSDAIIVNERYGFIQQLLALATVKEEEYRLSLSDKIDRVLTHRLLALPIFALFMWGIYFLSIQSIGTMGTDWVNDVLFGSLVPDILQQLMNQWQVAQWLQELIQDGIVAGVGAVLGFVPQIFVLFFCLALLEDCGYMARIAFVMDRLFRKFGLSGKSFIPMLIATGCGVPGVMASRTIENEKDRRLTVMVTTFMPCSAKLPIIALISGAFFPGSSWVAPSAYFIGMGAIILSGIALKKTALFAGDPAPFIMELPAYHLPQLGTVLKSAIDRAVAFIKKAGTIIFVACIFIWFTSSYNFTFDRVGEEESILAFFGRLLAPIFAPLGWGTWRGAVATITGLVAKENVIGTFGILYGQSGVSETGTEIWQVLRGDYTPVAAYSFLIFNLLCAPCFAAIGAIHREMGDSKWTWLAISYQCGLAYCASLIVYQFGHIFFEGGQLTVGTLAALIVLGLLLFSLIKRPQQKNSPLLQVVGEVVGGEK
ncbi:ferrous iron transport protein B [Enterococcus gallinarum]|uniref:Ferrous iron transport protein B n=1 Tax=Enterococcus gallinarum TaxID=1353 RepID=A0AAE7SZ23_ENTGA|nr:ferrous iron transport protein B [Enterococcus gallinarum]MBM6742471.1 ferrous iron transport protein B [Enterococcus gallinarum]QOG26375.1 ferrous iron transport protein B [Enterococcus gallinarum]RBT37290.1 ferrous iron transporter B [Enterococcus gallinarum]ROY72022.1 ferrous iron transport protein B [Enterococcus gallinarum]ROZ06666.1 ferrous iron transport protein B [Enterococcus gallinarum]